jgi:hypothetical protein
MHSDVSTFMLSSNNPVGGKPLCLEEETVAPRRCGALYSKK